MTVTFAKKAARSLRERLLTRKAEIAASYPSVAHVDISNMHMGTLHSIASDVMREFRYRPYQDTQLLDELEQLMLVHKNAVGQVSSQSSTATLSVVSGLVKIVFTPWAPILQMNK